MQLSVAVEVPILILKTVISRIDNSWVAHFLDLNPCDFFLWGLPKDNVYAGNLTTLQHLKTEITRFIRASPADKCKRLIANFAVGLNEHFEHIL